MIRNKCIPLAIGSIIVLSLSCSATVRKREIKPTWNIIGRWQGVDRTGKEGAFNFFKDGTMQLIIDGRALGGAEQNGFGGLRFTVNYAADPIELDIVGLDHSGAEHGKILMIIKFITGDKIKIRTFFNDIRPDNFDNESIDDTILLDRKTD